MSLTGDNGTGKSTLVGAIAVAAGHNPEGGSVNFRFATRSKESALRTSQTRPRDREASQRFLPAG